MGTENSSKETRQRAKQLADSIGRSALVSIVDSARVTQVFCSYHTDFNMDSIVTAVRQLFTFVTGTRPEFRSRGGSNAENLALQNIQVCLAIYIF
jgi:NAD+ synthase (glutamine-hydrolysing)